MSSLGVIQYKGSKHQCCWALISICENRWCTFLLGINKITFMHVPTSSSAHHPITPPQFLSWPGMVTFCTYCYNCNSIYHYGQVTATLRWKISCCCFPEIIIPSILLTRTNWMNEWWGKTILPAMIHPT